MNWKPVKSLIRRIHQNRQVRKAQKFRNAVMEGRFRSRRAAEGQAFADELRRTGFANYCFAIAFNTPWVIDALTKTWLTYTTGVVLVVVDNSSRRAAREAIEAICRSRGIALFRLAAKPGMARKPHIDELDISKHRAPPQAGNVRLSRS